MFLTSASKGSNQIGMYLLGIAIIMVAYVLGQTPMLLVQLYKVSQNPDITESAIQEFSKTMDFGIFGIHKNTGLILLILIFFFAMAGLLIALKIQKKNIKDLITPKANIDVNKILFGFAFWMALSVIFEAMMYTVDPSNYVFRFNAGSFLGLLLIAFVMLPVQTSFEELFFRGYLMQGIAWYSKNKWVPLMVTSVLFGLIHGMNPEVEKFGFWTMQVYYVTAGLFLGIITLLDDSLELALGVHAATNIFGATISTYEGSVLQTDSLLAAKLVNPLLMLLIFIIAAIIFILVCYKKYKWPHLRSLLNPVDFSQSEPSFRTEA